ncbi:MAG: hypothetical protein L0K86_25125, partial [Actinomycetia bacterium]|nr:hypothetical protein [Actinomycetes bacterium]
FQRPAFGRTDRGTCLGTVGLPADASLPTRVLMSVATSAAPALAVGHPGMLGSAPVAGVDRLRWAVDNRFELARSHQDVVEAAGWGGS